ncbi:MAG: peptide chain release factor 1 [Proteobacteria bacterium]|nr:peptide chain release factor 1 [Pseudomonadota bacterium]
MFDRLEEVEQKYRELEVTLSDPNIFQDMERYQKLTRERARLTSLVERYQRYKKISEEIENNRQFLHDDDEGLKDLAREEIAILKKEKEELEENLRFMLLPKDPRDERNVILEIRAGTGGEEAALIAKDLFRMYAKFAERRRWRVDILSQSITGLKGAKEIIALIEGEGVYSQMKHESGVHRVQRVPDTETQGRTHTSAVTVAVLPEAEDVDVVINPDDLKIDVYRSSGPGGQSVNTTDSAVRVTHLPTGLVVTCQDEKSQHKNKAKAIKVLRSRLLDLATKEQQDKISKERKSQVGSGDRSERIRTYNFPQGRVTDHRVGLTLYRIETIMMGDIQDILDHLTAHFQAESLKESGLDLITKPQ